MEQKCKIANILGAKKNMFDHSSFFFFNANLDRKLDLRDSNWSVCSLKVVDVIGE